MGSSSASTHEGVRPQSVGGQGIHIWHRCSSVSSSTSGGVIEDSGGGEKKILLPNPRGTNHQGGGATGPPPLGDQGGAPPSIEGVTKRSVAGPGAREGGPRGKPKQTQQKNPTGDLVGAIVMNQTLTRSFHEHLRLKSGFEPLECKRELLCACGQVSISF